LAKFYGDSERWQTIIINGEVFDSVDGDECDAFAPDYANNRQDSGQRAREWLEKNK